MKTWLFIIVVVLFLALGPPVGWSMENPAIRNPIGSATVPPSSSNSGLVNTPDPIDTSSGNLVITGNVRRGRHFRGPVPYRSTASFGTSVDSASLSSFLRDSAGSEDFGRYSGGYRLGPAPGGSYQPYYSRTETVTTTTPGRAGVFRPASTRSNNPVQDVYGLEPLSEKSTAGQSSQGTSAQSGAWRGLPGLGPQVPQMQYGTLAEPRSTSLSPRPTERLTTSQVDPRRQGENSAIERYRRQRQDPRLGLVPLESQDSRTAFGPESGISGVEEQQNLPETDGSSRYSRFEMQIPGESTAGAKRTDAIRYPLPALDKFTPSTDSTLQESTILQSSHFTESRQTGALQDGASWEPASKADDQVTELGERDTGYLRTPTFPYQSSTGSRLTRAGRERGQRDELPSSKEERVSGPDVLEQVRQHLDDLVKSIEARQTQDSRSSSVLSQNQDSRPVFGQGFVEPVPEDSSQKRSSVPAEQDSFPLEELSELSTFPNTRKGVLGLSEDDLSARAKRIMGPHKSHESFSEAKFTQHMRVAEDYLKAGRYYRAADSFTLASIYVPDNPLALAGKGHALFAAGEYVSSALFLSRTLEIAPEYARTEIDLVATLGDANKLTSRIADVEQWLKGSGATELQFLLGYIYYRTGKLSQAKQAIDAVREKTPRSQAAQAIGAAIDDTITGHRKQRK